MIVAPNGEPLKGFLNRPSEKPPLPHEPREIIKDRLTVVETVYHQPYGEEPTAVESGFMRWLQTREQPCVRRLTATEDWQAIEGGWIERAGMLVLTNEEGRAVMVQPTEEEREHRANKVLEVTVLPLLDYSLESPCWLVLPGESLRGQPADLKSLRIRARKGFGPIRYTAALFPW